MTEAGRDSKRVGSLPSPLPSSLLPPCEYVQRYVRAVDWCVCARVCVCAGWWLCELVRSVGDRRLHTDSKITMLTPLPTSTAKRAGFTCSAYWRPWSSETSLLRSLEKRMRFRFWNYFIRALLGTLFFYSDWFVPFPAVFSSLHLLKWKQNWTFSKRQSFSWKFDTWSCLDQTWGASQDIPTITNLIPLTPFTMCPTGGLAFLFYFRSQ